MDPWTKVSLQSLRYILSENKRKILFSFPSSTLEVQTLLLNIKKEADFVYHYLGRFKFGKIEQREDSLSNQSMGRQYEKAIPK